ncbi:hypothetical protein [Nonomuraea sp. NPDC048826]|uniref:hypothetical protein n=1 Tax=Nonomuraea sp. NPDC048826 TaxID=3364347 RepID=UPI0037120994
MDGAALLVLLGLALGLPLVMPAGAPDPAELDRIPAGLPEDFEAAVRGGAVRIMPTDGNDLLLLSVACLGTAVLLMALGFVRRRH